MSARGYYVKRFAFMGTLTHDKYYIIALKEKNTLELPVSYVKLIFGHMLCTFLFSLFSANNSV